MPTRILTKIKGYISATRLHDLNDLIWTRWKGIDEWASVQNNQDRSSFYRLLTTIYFNSNNETISVSLIQLHCTTYWISDDIARQILGGNTFLKQSCP